MGFKLRRYSNFYLNESLSFNGKDFVRNVEDEGDFGTSEEYNLLKSPVMIEVTLEEGGHYLQHIEKNDKEYSVYLATKNNSLWLMTTQDNGLNTEYSFDSEDPDLEHPVLVIEVKSKKDPRHTYILDHILSFLQRTDPSDDFTDFGEYEEEQFETIASWPLEVRACLTEYAFEKVHIKYDRDEIQYTSKTVTISCMDGNIATAFGDNQEAVKGILCGDYHEYFEYQKSVFKDNYLEAFKMLNEANLKDVFEEYNITTAEDLKELVDDGNDEALELQDRLIRAYKYAQEIADSNDCYNHIVKTFASETKSEYNEGHFIFSHGEFGKFVHRMSSSGTNVSDLFKKGDVKFDFHDNYYETLDPLDFNSEFSENKI
jgi:hypothetical protein